MGSETGAKWFVVIIIYFAVMTFIVGLIGQTAGTSFGNESVSIGTYCDSPRDIHIAYSEDVIDWDSTIAFNWKNHYDAHIECKRSAGVLGQDTCESIEGCIWDTPTFWYIPLGSATCIGTMNQSFITTTGTHNTIYGEEIDDFDDINGDNTDIICEHPTVLNNETLCNIFSCSWYYHTGANELEIDEPKLSGLKAVWNTAKEMITFRFDFGFNDPSLMIILNFLVFYLPLIGFIISGYIMVRS